MSCESNRLGWMCFCLASLRIVAWRRAVTQSRPAGWRSFSMRVWAIMPRSPTSATRSRPKRGAQVHHLLGEGGRVGGVALEGAHGNGAALGVAQQAVDDLRAVGSVVAGVAAGSEFVAAALDVAGGDVVEGEGAVAEMQLGELALDGALAVGEPVHGVVEGIDLGVLEGEQGGEGGLAGGAELALDAQLGAGLEQAADDPGEHEGALATGLVEEQAVEAELADEAEDGADGAVMAGGAGPDGGGLGSGGSWFLRASLRRSMACWGRRERLARVRFLTLPSCQ